MLALRTRVLSLEAENRRLAAAQAPASPEPAADPDAERAAFQAEIARLEATSITGPPRRPE